MELREQRAVVELQRVEVAIGQRDHARPGRRCAAGSISFIAGLFSNFWPSNLMPESSWRTTSVSTSVTLLVHHLQPQRESRGLVGLGDRAEKAHLPQLRIGEAQVVAAELRQRLPQAIAHHQRHVVLGIAHLIGPGDARGIMRLQRGEVAVERRIELGARGAGGQGIVPGVRAPIARPRQPAPRRRPSTQRTSTASVCNPTCFRPPNRSMPQYYPCRNSIIERPGIRSCGGTQWIRKYCLRWTSRVSNSRWKSGCASRAYSRSRSCPPAASAVPSTSIPGEFFGPKLKGKAVPNSGGDYALFRPDDTAVFDARYMLQEDDGTLIMLYNKGFLWGRKPDVMDRLRKWAFEGGAPVPHCRILPARQSDLRNQHGQARLAHQACVRRASASASPMATWCATTR